jgi:CrcB protein
MKALSVLLVFLGGGVGSVLRYGAGAASVALFGAGFPWATLAVNAAGGLAIGVLAAHLDRGHGLLGFGPAEARLLLMTGVLGGFTTFSAFSLETVALWERGAPGLAAAYVLASVALSVGGAALGLALGRGLG